MALRGLPEPVLLDEWQRVPGVLGAVRRALEADPHPNRFYVTGSVRAELEHEVWPGTGRLVRLTMYPMTVAEQLGHSGPPLLDKLADGQELTVPEDPAHRAGPARDRPDRGARGAESPRHRGQGQRGADTR